MRKLFYFLMLGAIALGVSSCDPNGEVINPDQDHLSNFSVSAEYTAPQKAAITVTSADKNCYFFAFHDEAVLLPIWTKEKINDYMKSYFEDATYPADLYQDQHALTARDLKENTKYVVLAFKVGDGYKVDGVVEYKFFTTPASWR